MKIETQLLHENGQYIHDGDPLYEGDQLVGWFRGFHDEGAGGQMVSIERPRGGGMEHFGVGLVKDFNTRPSNGVAQADDRDVEALNRKGIEASLLRLARLDKRIHELVEAALAGDATQELQDAAGAALCGVANNRVELEKIPF